MEGAHHEEQKDEIEALECIFVDEYELLSENPIKFEIHLKADWDEEESNFVELKLIIEFQEEYPEVVPKFQIKNMSEDRISNNELYECENLFRHSAEEMLGEPMIYEITEKLKEYLIEKNDVFIEQKEEEEAKAVEAAK